MDFRTMMYYKDLYNGHKILYVRFLEEEFLFRTLTIREYSSIQMGEATKLDMQDSICQTALLYPEDYNFSYCTYAGLPEVVSQKIEELSGFHDMSLVVQEYESELSNETMLTQCKDLIKAFIPEYTYEEMDDWTWEKIARMTARAVHVAHLRGFENIGMVRRDEEAKDAYNAISIDNQEFIQKLEDNGIDPMIYFEEELKDMTQGKILEFPFIVGTHYNDGVIIDVLQQQLSQKTPR